MVSFRLRTKFLFSLFLVGLGLTSATLFVARRTVERQIRLQIFQDIRNSVSTFQNVQRQRERFLEHSAQLLADLPILKALMTTEHAATIQDGSKELWGVAGSDLLVIADRNGLIVATHTRLGDFGKESAQAALAKSLHEEEHAWWLVNGRLYQISLQPIESGPHGASRGLGYLVLGDEVDDAVVRELSQVASSQVAFRYGNNIVRSSLSSLHEAELSHQLSEKHSTNGRDPEEVRLGQENYLQAIVSLSPGIEPGVQLIVLKSLDEATAFLGQLNRLLLALALVALAVASSMVFLFSHTFTRPLAALVDAVRALGKADYDYPVAVRGQDEVAEVTAAFLRMRSSLRESQRKLIESERLATIGRMANSISHDLRHSLAAILANAEFLTENNRTVSDRAELYQEVRSAVNEMTELIDSLLEFSRTREALHPTYGDLEDSVARAIHSVSAHPDFHSITILVHREEETDAWFDARKMERVFQNLIRNACEAVSPDHGRVDVYIRADKEVLRIKVEDNGRGIPEIVRERLFEPFVSQGKENGTGLGLTIVQKIVQDHGGIVQVESTSSAGTTFLIELPRSRGTPVASANGEAVVRSVIPIKSDI